VRRQSPVFTRIPLVLEVMRRRAHESEDSSRSRKQQRSRYTISLT
jgi:hypothetical protein